MEILVYLRICILFHLLGVPKLLEDLRFLSQENAVHSCQRYVAQELAHSTGDTTHSRHSDRAHGNPNPFFQLLTSGPLMNPLIKKGLNHSPVKHIKNEKYLIG